MPAKEKQPARLAESAYAKIKSDLFDFSLMPGERFSENDIAERRLCERVPMPALDHLRYAWLVLPEARTAEGTSVSLLDEKFHTALAVAAGNAELARVHADITERIRVIRRLDFMYPERIRSTYTEHAQILRAVLRRKTDQATLLLKVHIEESKVEVRKISLHKLIEAKAANRGA